MISVEWVLCIMKYKDAINQFTKWKTLQVKQGTIYGYYWQLVNFGIFLHNKDIEKITEKDITDYLYWSDFFGHRGSTKEKQAIAIKKLSHTKQVSQYTILILKPNLFQ